MNNLQEQSEQLQRRQPERRRGRRDLDRPNRGRRQKSSNFSRRPIFQKRRNVSGKNERQQVKDHLHVLFCIKLAHYR
jgi:hypothetical protein